MTTAERIAEGDKHIPEPLAVTLVTHYVDGSSEDWHFSTARDAKDFILSVQAAKQGFGEEWMIEIFKIELRPFMASAN